MTVALLVFMVVSVAWAIREIRWSRRQMRKLEALEKMIEEEFGKP